MRYLFMPVDLTINPEKKAQQLTRFIKETVRKAGFSKVILGLSAGVDSTTVYYLALRALGRERVFGVVMPYGLLNKEEVKDAKLIISNLKLPEKNIYIINIKSIVDKIHAYDKTMDDLRLGNIAVRTRMILLFDLAKKKDALVLGTENKTEYLLGYFTRFGDEASDIEPIRGLYKTQVIGLADYLGVPKKILKKTPSAHMWKNQTDEGEFGFSYKDADQILSLFVDKKYKVAQIIKQGFSKEVVARVLARVKRNEFKHKVPYIYSSKF